MSSTFNGIGWVPMTFIHSLRTLAISTRERSGEDIGSVIDRDFPTPGERDLALSLHNFDTAAHRYGAKYGNFSRHSLCFTDLKRQMQYALEKATANDASVAAELATSRDEKIAAASQRLAQLALEWLTEYSSEELKLVIESWVA